MIISCPFTPRRVLRLCETTTAEGRFVRQAGCPSNFGHVILKVQPVDTEGLEIVWEVGLDGIPAEFRPAVEQGIQEFMANDSRFQGAWFTKTQVRVVGGSHHLIDSSHFSFKVATLLAWREVLINGLFVDAPPN